MAKIQIAAPRQKKDTLLQFLQEEEVIHATPDHESSPSHTDTAYHLAQVQFGLEFIGRLRTRLNEHPKRNLRLLFAPRPAANIDVLEQRLAAMREANLLDRMQTASDALAELDGQHEEIGESIAELTPWKNLALRGEAAVHQTVTHLLLRCTTHNEELIHEHVSAMPTAIWQEVLRTQDGKQTTLHAELVVHESDQKRLEELLRMPGVERVELALDEDMTVADRLQELTREQTGAQRRTEEVLTQAREFLPHEQDLQFAYDALLHRQEREHLEAQMIILDRVVVLTGWLPKPWLATFTRRLEKHIPTAALSEIESAADDIPPVALLNKPAVRPFEAVTNIYGKPAYSELDPTPILALFFLIAFGLALTDAGYGLVMMATMWSAERFFKLKREMRRMVRLLFYGGASTTVLGALTGGWFGISLEALSPGTIRDALLSIKLVDPVSQPMVLLAVALALGILQLLVAWGVRGYHNWQTGKRINVFLDDVPWITMVVLLLAWIGARQGILPAGIAPAFGWASVANAAFLVATQGRQQKNPFLKLGTGALSLYNLVSFLSDTLSYSRLLALGLATGIIGLVVNLIASLAADAIPVVGILLAGLVLLGGHLFNLGINVLGAFIHSGRLQFVEFFPKFMEGGGTPFTPFGRVSRYVDNPREFT